MTDEELEKIGIQLRIPYAEILPNGSWRINRTAIIDEVLKRDRVLREISLQRDLLTAVPGGGLFKARGVHLNSIG